MTAQSMFSDLWHRVEAVRPRLRPQTQIERHVIRGQIWYVAKHRLSSRAQRCSPAVYAVLMRMDGTRTLADIWREVAERLLEDAPSQDQIIQLVSQLYTYDLIQVDRPVDMGELTERAEKVRSHQMLQRFQNPVYFRLPLFDPNRFLERTLPLVRPLASPWGALVWLAAVGWLIVQAALHWPELNDGIADRVLAADNLVLLLIVFPLLKVLHELGHAYACKLLGGDIHEIGVMFLVLMPVPYVDASASTMFARKWARIMVAAAGMLVELFVASIAMLVWLSAEPGLVRALAFNTLLIASVSTLAFNGNPLLRFDAYYILSDLLEIPNLSGRATMYWGYLTQRYVFGLRTAVDPVSSAGEPGWFLVYAPSAFIYRLTVLFGIAAFLATHFFVVGIALVIWTLAVSLGWPIVKALRFVITSPQLAAQRRRSIAVTLAGAGLAAILLFVVPVPYGTVARGVVWVPDNARVAAETNGTVVRVLSVAGTTVAREEPLLQLEDPYLAAQRRLTQAKLAELQHRLLAAEVLTPYETQVLRKQIELATDELAEADRKFSALTVRSKADGVFVINHAQDLTGAYVKKGELLGYVMPLGDITVRAVVPETDIDDVQRATRSVAARLDGVPGETVYNLPVTRLVPQATHQLPSSALAQGNGGPFATDPSAKTPDTTLLPFFELDVTLPQAAPATRWGERAWLRFDHGPAPVSQRLYRSFRQIFLKRFNV
jgi:putative peptide zinc metalloprotease protein